MWAEVRRETGRGNGRFNIRELFADERCSLTILDFLSTTDVGSQTTVTVEEGAHSKASGCELREQREREEERRAEAQELSGEGEEKPLFLLTSSVLVSAEEE